MTFFSSYPAACDSLVKPVTVGDRSPCDLSAPSPDPHPDPPPTPLALSLASEPAAFPFNPPFPLRAPAAAPSHRSMPGVSFIGVAASPLGPSIRPRPSLHRLPLWHSLSRSQPSRRSVPGLPASAAALRVPILTSLRPRVTAALLGPPLRPQPALHRKKEKKKNETTH